MSFFSSPISHFSYSSCLLTSFGLWQILRLSLFFWCSIWWGARVRYFVDCLSIWIFLMFYLWLYPGYGYIISTCLIIDYINLDLLAEKLFARLFLVKLLLFLFLHCALWSKSLSAASLKIFLNFLLTYLYFAPFLQCPQIFC